MKIKRCSHCKIYKLLNKFSKNNFTKDKKQTLCKTCHKKYHKEYSLKNKYILSVKVKQYQQKNKNKINKQKLEYYYKNRLKILQYKRMWCKKRRKQLNLAKLKYYNKNKAKINNVRRKNYNKKYKGDINFRLRMLLRGRVRVAIKNNTKGESTRLLIGCSIDFLKKYLYRKFKKGMSWKNYGQGFGNNGMKEWHIDHIKPCVSFDLSKLKEQRKCFHYTNLQPLWAEENRKKRNKIK